MDGSPVPSADGPLAHSEKPGGPCPDQPVIKGQHERLPLVGRECGDRFVERGPPVKDVVRSPGVGRSTPGDDEDG